MYQRSMTAPQSTAMSNPSAEEHELSLRLKNILRECFGSDDAAARNGHRGKQRCLVAARAPGRVNLLGGHTD
jgi:hypothetical protein